MTTLANTNTAAENAAPQIAAQLLVRSLMNQGVKHILGIPGGKIMRVFDVLDDEGPELIVNRQIDGPPWRLPRNIRSRYRQSRDGLGDCDDRRRPRRCHRRCGSTRGCFKADAPIDGQRLVDARGNEV